MLIGLTGYAGSGKDTVAEILVREHGFKRYAFADKLRELVYAQNPLIEYWEEPALGSLTVPLQDMIEHVGWDRAKRDYPQVRELLQHTGVWMRENVSQSFWIDQVAWQYEALMESTFGDANVVVTDVRFANEAEWITDEEGYVLRVDRPGVGPVNGHESEALNFEIDGTLKNAGTLDDLRAAVAEWVNFS